MKHGRKVVAVAVSVALSGGAGGAGASGFALIEQNASGIGNAYAGAAAAAEDASTIFFNPAGMTRLPGMQFVVADYSQIELRLLAHFSEDPAFIGAFERGGDIHRETAAIIFDVPVDRVTSEMRARAKTINFATIYGQGPFALSRQLAITQEQAKDFIRRYFERLSGVRRYLDSTIEQAKKAGYVETLRGRRRYIPELRDANYNIRAFGERTAMNSPLQGSAADLIKVAMINVARGLRREAPGSGMVLQVHDELIIEAADAEVEAASRVVHREMEGAARLRVPLVVDVGVGPNWLDAKH